MFGRATSRELASEFRRPVKEISNDLRRMRLMGFVKRIRERRLCHSRYMIRSRELFYRGFQYSYYLSEQGKRYLKWMNEKKQTWDRTYRQNLNMIAANLQAGLKKQLFEYYFCRSVRTKARKYKSPSHRYEFLADLAFTNSAIFGEPSPLELENQRLTEENQRLTEKNKRLATELENTKL